MKTEKVSIGNVIILTALLATIGYLAFDKVYSEHDKILELLSESSKVYVYETEGDHWQTCKETEQLGTGDCEDMALLLHSKLKDAGYHPRLCLGVVHETSTNLHMWVEIDFDGREYILDPTANAIFEKRNPMEYMNMPLYLFKDKIAEWETRNGKEDRGENRIPSKQDRD